VAKICTRNTKFIIWDTFICSYACVVFIPYVILIHFSLITCRKFKISPLWGYRNALLENSAITGMVELSTQLKELLV